MKKIKTDGSKTLYVGGIYEVNKNSGGAVTGTVTYYPAAGAMRINSTLYFVLKDHLGSASVVTDSTGATVGEDRFYPFGETRFTTGSMFTDKLFTSQREITGLGIYHYGARFYSPKLGRFLSADSIVPGYANPQNLNRYSYVLNNPLGYIDPSGHNPCRSDYLCKRRAERMAATQAANATDKTAHPGMVAQSACDNLYCTYSGDPFSGGVTFGGFPGSNSNTFGGYCATHPDEASCGGPDSGSTPGGSGGWRRPDYGTLQISVGPWWGGVVTFMWADGHIYTSLGGTLGKPLADVTIAGIPASGNLSGGWVWQSTRPSPQELRNFLTGWTINGSVGAGLGGGVTWGNVGRWAKDALAFEGGLYAPQIGVSATYTVIDYNIKTKKLEWLPCNVLFLHKSC